MGFESCIRAPLIRVKQEAFAHSGHFPDPREGIIRLRHDARRILPRPFANRSDSLLAIQDFGPTRQ